MMGDIGLSNNTGLQSEKNICFISLSCQRGKKTMNENGTSSYALDDAFSVFDNVKGTPKYWRKRKDELLAKLNNLGP